MTLPLGTNAISIAQINTELGRASTAQFSLNDTEARKLAGTGGTGISNTSGTPINLDAFHAKSRAVITLSANVLNVNVLSRFTATSYSAGKTYGTVTINNGVYVGSSISTNPAFSVSGFTTGDIVEVFNNGFIVGAGGAGGKGYGGTAGAPDAGYPGADGGTAVYARSNVFFTNNGTLWGGGGGGGGGSGSNTGGKGPVPLGGGGGGGGAGQNVGDGGPGGTNNYGNTGDAGSAGSLTTGGAGGVNWGSGGAGGNIGQPGVSATYAGGAAGKYVDGNAFVSWLANGTRVGGAS